MTIKRSILQVALVAIALGAGAGAAVLPAQQGSTTDEWCRDGGDFGGGDERITHCEVRDFTVPASGAVLAVSAAPNGGIQVEGADRQDIAVRARITTTARSAEQARTIASRIQIVATADRVQAEGPTGLARRESWSVSYRIAAPRQTPLSLNSTNGGISVADINSQIEFRTVNGGVKLTRLGGDVRGRTTNGGVTVDLDGTSWDGQGLDVQTTNGGVKLAIPAGYSAHLEAETRNGGFRIDFPVTVQGRLGRAIATDIGGGGPPIKLRTSNGGIRIDRK